MLSLFELNVISSLPKYQLIVAFGLAAATVHVTGCSIDVSTTKGLFGISKTGSDGETEKYIMY